MVKTRVVLLIGLISVIALGSALVGVWVGRSGAAQTAMINEGSPVVGQPVGGGSTRLFSDPRKTNLVFEVESGRVYRGPVSQGQTILFFDGRRIYRGANTTGEILFAVSGGRIFVGPNTTGPIAYTVRNGRIFEGTEKGPIAYTVRGDRLFRGSNATGPIVFEANRSLSGSIQFLLPILADRRF